MSSASQNFHQLIHNWTFWTVQLKCNDSTGSYDIDPICSFDNVEKFWYFFRQFPPINQLQRDGIALFKSGIRPAWEDPKNLKGYSVHFVNVELTQEIWENIILGLIGGTFEDFMCKIASTNKIEPHSINGVYVTRNSSYNSLSISFWYEQSNKKVNPDDIKTFFNISSFSLFKIKEHQNFTR